MFTPHEWRMLLLSSVFLLAILLDYVKPPKRKKGHKHCRNCGEQID